MLEHEQVGGAIAHLRDARDRSDAVEQVTVEVTDANGLAATAVVTPRGADEASPEAVPGGGECGTLAAGRPTSASSRPRT